MTLPTMAVLDTFVDYCDRTDGKISKIVGDALLWQELEGIELSVGNREVSRIAEEIRSELPNLTIVDFGCGSRNYHDYFEGLGLRWIGLDVKDSRDPKAVAVADIEDGSILYYDGLEIPLESEQIGAVFSNQTFEHVNNIDRSLSEIQRILAPGGYLFGSVAQTEPYHSISTFNWSPYGIKLAFERNGLKVLSLRAGVDVISLAFRYLANAFGATSALHLLDESMFSEGKRPLWDKIQDVAKAAGQSEREAASVCLGLAGHVQFIAIKERRLGQVGGDPEEIAAPLFPTQSVPKATRPIPQADIAIGAPFAPVPLSWVTDDSRLAVCQEIPNETEINEIIELRSPFRVGDYPDPYVTDVVRAFRLLRDKETYLEIGTYDRGNLAYMASILSDTAVLIGIDVQDEPTRDALLRSKLRPGQTYTHIVGSSRSPEVVAAVKERLGLRKLDGVFIDGDHTAYSVLCDYANYEKLVADDGVFLFHDSAWEGDEEYKGVVDALDEINRRDPVYLIEGENRCRKYSRPMWRQQLWGCVGLVFARDQAWRRPNN